MKTKATSLAKKQALIVLLLFVPASSIGVTMALFVAPGLVGNGIFTLVKIWIVILPLFWTWKNNPHKLRVPKFQKSQIVAGFCLGILMFISIYITYLLLGKSWINLVDIRTKAQEVGITNTNIYLAGFFYWSFINSFIEECIWRGFVYSQCQILFPAAAAILFASLFFTLHHSIAIYGYTHNWMVAFIGSLGVFIAGAIWSLCYKTYNSIIPGYISHILADIAIAFVGWQLLFG